MRDPLRVLIIDDNDDDCSMIMCELQQRFGNLRAEQVCKADALSLALEQGEFDVTILEHQLHWTKSLDVLKNLKARYPDRPVIMFTRYGHEEIAVVAIKAGLDDYLVKAPQHYARLADIVQSVLTHATKQHESEELYHNLFARVPVGLFRSNAKGQILDANPALVEMFGYPNREALLALNAAEIYVHPEDRQRWQLLMEREEAVHGFEVQLRRHDGTVFWGRANAYIIRDMEGHVAYYEGMVEDMTSRKEIEEVLRLLDAAVGRLDQLVPAETSPRSTPSTIGAGSQPLSPVRIATDPGAASSRGQATDLLQRVRPKGFRQQQLNVRIDPTLAERLRLFCAERRFKVLDIVTVALERLLEELETGHPHR